MFEKKKLIEILSSKKKLNNKKIKVKILSNLILNNLSEILDYYLSEIGLDPEITVGNYDNIIQEIEYTKDYDLVIIYFELCNTVDEFDINLFTKDEKYLDDIFNKIKKDINFINENIAKEKLIFFNKLSYRVFVNHFDNHFKLKSKIDELNNFIINLNNKNLILVDIENIFMEIGIKNCIDKRLFYSSKVLYNPNFFIEYSILIASLLTQKLGLGKKVLILDCDNTLWRGIVGDDGPNGIDMSKNSEIGSYFYKAQTILKSFKKKGILLCICSKNNLENVNEILKGHPDMQLKDEDILLKKINWNDKYKNIAEISDELNIYADNFIFLDDSDFEINCIKHYLPEVMCVQVPKDLSEYPKKLLQLSSILETKSLTLEDKKKYQLYRDEEKRNNSKKTTASIEEYLKSLNIKCSIFLNNKEHIRRISQLTSKTNQFNMNKKILDEDEVLRLFNDKNYYFFTCKVEDNFGDLGITNLAIIHIKKNEAFIDNMIMSCRVFGRKIEYSFLNFVLDFFKKKKVNLISSCFKENFKNKQFNNFYIENGLKINYKKNNTIWFKEKINKVSIIEKIDHIKIQYKWTQKKLS